MRGRLLDRRAIVHERDRRIARVAGTAAVTAATGAHQRAGGHDTGAYASGADAGAVFLGNRDRANTATRS